MKYIIFFIVIVIFLIAYYAFKISDVYILPILAVLYFVDKYWTDSKKKLNNSGKGLLFNKNVIITGGSSGIGKSVAIAAAAKGANVTIIARNFEKLQIARDEICEACINRDEQKIETLVLDVSGDYDFIERAFLNLEKQQGPPYMLINCAGMAHCGKIEDIHPDLVKYMVNLNLLGTYYCIKAVTRSMKLSKKGKIVLVSSQAGLLGIFGYSAYCSTKFALKGLAESLVMELSPYNISVTLCLPPDTDTPGFEIEQQSKPVETLLISESGGLFQPEVVAKKLLDDALNEKFFSFVGRESFLLTTLCSGMSPFSSFLELITQSVLMGPIKLCSVFFLYHFRTIVNKCMSDREKLKKSQ